MIIFVFDKEIERLNHVVQHRSGSCRKMTSLVNIIWTIENILKNFGTAILCKLNKMRADSL